MIECWKCISLSIGVLDRALTAVRHAQLSEGTVSFDDAQLDKACASLKETVPSDSCACLTADKARFSAPKNTNYA